MPYITGVERLGLEKGIEREKNLVIRQLKRKLGEDLSSDLEDVVKSLEIEQVEALGEALLDFASVNDLREWLSNH
jgi:predicted transcriptional regulator